MKISSLNHQECACVQCGSPLFLTNGYEMDVLFFCCKLKCPNFGLLQLGTEKILRLLKDEKSKNSRWVKIIEE